MRIPRRGVAVLAAALALGPAAGCSSAPQPAATSDAYLAAWARQDWAAMQKLTSHPPADFTAINQAAFGSLTVRQASFTAGAMHAAGPTASTPVTERAPQLVTSVADGTAAATTGSPPRPLPATLVSALHQMMASVVARGTAAGQGLPAGTYAKTGTAQYGAAKPLKTDAWLMGFKGDIAFAALVVNSAGNGGPTCGPIVARFLRGL